MPRELLCVLEFDFNEYEVCVTGVDDIMLNAYRSVVRHASGELAGDLSLWRVEQQRAGGLWNHDIIHAMPMPAGFAAGRKAPLGDCDLVIINLDGRYRSRTVHLLLLECGLLMEKRQCIAQRLSIASLYVLEWGPSAGPALLQ